MLKRRLVHPWSNSTWTWLTLCRIWGGRKDTITWRRFQSRGQAPPLLAQQVPRELPASAWPSSISKSSSSCWSSCPTLVELWTTSGTAAAWASSAPPFPGPSSSSRCHRCHCHVHPDYHRVMMASSSWSMTLVWLLGALLLCLWLSFALGFGFSFLGLSGWHDK